MIGARIKCDNCNFIGEMAMTSNCSSITAPEGWAVVSPMIRIKGERSLSPLQRKELKIKIKEKTPPFHVCPQCIFGAWEVRVGRLLGFHKTANT